MRVEKKKIAFLIIADKNITNQTLILIESIKRTYKNYKFSINVATENSEIQKYKNYDNSINVKTVMTDDQYSLGKLINDNITNFTFLRLKLFEIFNDIPEEWSCVYIDYDTFFKRKIRNKYINSTKNIAFNEFFDHDNINKSLWYWKEVISSPMIYSKIKMQILNKSYFNAGVLIINNRKTYNDLCDKVNKSSFLQDDQTLLNFFLDDEFEIVEDYKSNNRVLNNFKSNSFIFHFSGNHKPWNYNDLVDNNFNLLRKCKKIGYFKIMNYIRGIEND